MEFRISMSELKAQFLTAAKNGASRLSLSNRTNYARTQYILDMDSEFAGASTEDFVSHCETGYSVAGMELDTSVIPVRKRKRSRYNDCEGDFRYDEYSSGNENCFVEWTKREAIPGIHVQFFLGFVGFTPASVITEYCAWILSALVTLESAGVDCSVSVFNRGMDRSNGIRSRSDEFHIDVKREGERNDFTEWSAILAPGSYRKLGFFCLMLAADSRNESVAANFGRSTGNHWGVTYDSEKKIIEISAESGTNHFPADQMTAALGAAIASARGE